MVQKGSRAAEVHGMVTVETDSPEAAFQRHPIKREELIYAGRRHRTGTEQ